MPRKVALCVVMLCATLVSGCMAAAEVPPTAAEVHPVIQERSAVAQQHWAAAHAFQRAPLGFKVRLEVAVGSFNACSPDGADGGGSGGLQYQIVSIWEPVGVPLPSRPACYNRQCPPSRPLSTTLGGASSSRPHRAG